MEGTILRTAIWLGLAYLTLKAVAAYYVAAFASGRLTAALSTFATFSLADAVIALLTTAALLWSAHASEWIVWTKNILAPRALRFLGTAEGARRAGLDPQAIEVLRTDLRALALRCRSELEGPPRVEFASLCNSAEDLSARLAGTELELQIAPLLTNLRLSTTATAIIATTDDNARRLRESGLDLRAHLEDNAALAERMLLLGYREQIRRTADIILRSTGPLAEFWQVQLSLKLGLRPFRRRQRQ